MKKTISFDFNDHINQVFSVNEINEFKHIGKQATQKANKLAIIVAALCLTAGVFFLPEIVETKFIDNISLVSFLTLVIFSITTIAAESIYEARLVSIEWPRGVGHKLGFRATLADVSDQDFVVLEKISRVSDEILQYVKEIAKQGRRPIKLAR